MAEAAGNVVLSDMLSGVRALLRVWIRRVIEAAGETLARGMPLVMALVRSGPEGTP